jgi:hypothetical protein
MRLFELKEHQKSHAIFGHPSDGPILGADHHICVTNQCNLLRNSLASWAKHTGMARDCSMIEFSQAVCILRFKNSKSLN